MKPLQISESKARNLYKTASEEFKATLEDTFGKEFFSQKITDRIKTYEDACVELGEEPLDEKAMLKAGFTPDEIIYRKIKTIVKALNEGWVPDMLDTDQYKYYPYFEVDKSSPSGFGFCGTNYGYSYASADSGSRLCFKNRELAEYAGRQFLELYADFIK